MNSLVKRIIKAAVPIDSSETLLGIFQDYLADVDKSWNYVLPTELYGHENDFFLVDIRKPEDFKKGHIKGAINIFWLDILNNLNKLPLNRKILIYCYLGHTSSQVLPLLKMLGYNVVSLKFGLGISPVKGVPMAGWVDYGYELETSHD